MDWNKMFNAGKEAVVKKTGEMKEKYSIYEEEASRLDDRLLVHKWRGTTDTIKKMVYMNEMKNRGMTSEDINRYS